MNGSSHLQRRPVRKLARRRLYCESLEPRTLLTAVAKWSEVGPGGGGALFSPSINPINPADIYVASDMSQLFHTTNSGANWYVVDFHSAQASHNSRVQFTSNAVRRYVLDYTDPNDSGGTRLLRSDNSGQSWQPTSDPTGGEAVSMVVDYDRPYRLIVSNYSNLWLSNNAGQSFEQKFATEDSAGIHIGGVLFDGDTIYVGTNQGLLRSTDNGVTFAAMNIGGIPADQRIVSFAGAKENGVTRFWAVTLGDADVYGGVQGWDYANYQGVYRLTLGQANWIPATTGIPAGGLPFYVAAAKNDVDTVYLGGSDSSDPIVLKSTNGGQSWSSVLHTDHNLNVQTGWSGDGGNRDWSYGETALGFAVSPLDSSRIVITDYGFAHMSSNGGTSWQALYVNPTDRNTANTLISQTKSYRSSGLDNTSAWQVAWADATNLVVGYSDIRAARSGTSGTSWTLNTPGLDMNSTYRIAKAADGTLYAAQATVHDMYQSTRVTDDIIDGGQGKVSFSTNTGQSWQVLHNFGHVVTWVAVDPNNPNRLYAAVAHSTAGGIYVTNNLQAGASSTWTKLPNPPRTQGHAFSIQVLNDGTLVASYSARRAGSPLVFTASSGVFVSTNSGQTWTDRTAAGLKYWTKDIVIDPHDVTQKTWYAAVFSGWGNASSGLGGLYRTTNRGVSWTRVNWLNRVNSITVSPTDANEAYLTTEINGLWYTSNLTAASPTFSQVASYRFREPMRVFYNPFQPSEVWVTSFGGGIFRGTVPAAGPPASPTPGAATTPTAPSFPQPNPTIALMAWDEDGLSSGTGPRTRKR